MKRHQPIVLCLIAALVFVRFTGVHMHIHNHSPAPDQDVAEVLHFGTSDDHGKNHSLDVDLSVLDASLSKKHDSDLAQPLLLAALLLLLLTWRSTVLVPRLASARRDWTTVHYRLPPSTAPPA